MREEFAISTARLVLREIRLSDDAALLSAMDCPQVAKMHSGGFRDNADVRDYISVLVREYEVGNFRTLAIADKATDMLLGTITIDKHKYFPRAELGYWIAAPYRNQGYTSEAVRAVLEYCITMLQLGRVQATHNVKNIASGRVLQKAGMKFEGTLRCYHGVNGESTNANMYSFIESDMEGSK